MGSKKKQRIKHAKQLAKLGGKAAKIQEIPRRSPPRLDFLVFPPTGSQEETQLLELLEELRASNKRTCEAIDANVEFVEQRLGEIRNIRELVGLLKDKSHGQVLTIEEIDEAIKTAAVASHKDSVANDESPTPNLPNQGA